MSLYAPWHKYRLKPVLGLMLQSSWSHVRFCGVQFRGWGVGVFRATKEEA